MRAPVALIRGVLCPSRNEAAFSWQKISPERYLSCSVKFLRFQIVRPVTGRQQQASKNHDTSTKWHSLLGSHPAQMSHESRAILNRLSI
ncbi:hypothetical protein CFRS1_v011561 [Colletotrichum fructicola]|nr:hypothetical protein CFRS1_v011561 [Colletotrichum fructicola]